MAAAAGLYYYCFSSDKNAPLYYPYKYIYMHIKYYIAAAPPSSLNLAIAAGDDRFYAFGSFNMARQYYSDKLDVFVLIKSHFSLGSRFIYNIYIHRYALYPARRILQCIHRSLRKTAKGCGGGWRKNANK